MFLIIFFFFTIQKLQEINEWFDKMGINPNPVKAKDENGLYIIIIGNNKIVTSHIICGCLYCPLGLNFTGRIKILLRII